MIHPRKPRTGFARARSALPTTKVMAWATGGLYVVSGSLGVIVATQIPEGPPGSKHVVFALAAAAVLIGIGLGIWGHHLRPEHFHVLAVLGTILLTITVYESTSSVAAVALASLYVSVAIDVCFFFPWALAAAHVLLAVACCMTALLLVPGTPWWAGVVASGATIGVGIVVALLSRFAAVANVDALTGLLNRRGFDRALGFHVAEAARTGSRLELIVLNLDRFHAINDMYGHRSGDELLRHVVGSWLPLLPPSAVLARLGGDGFAVVLPGTTQSHAEALTEHLRAKISPRSSAGVTSWQPGDSSSVMLGRADIALRRAKLSGGNRTALAPPRHAPLAAALADAIAEGHVGVVYQPVIDLAKDRTISGVEALLRWAPAGHSEVTTEEVVRVAEESGLVADLDHYVLRRACLDALELQGAKRDGPLTLNVNVSGLGLTGSDCVDRVDSALRETGWPPEQLVLEVTESVLDVDTPVAIATLHALRARGIRIAVDDFGTGYSSLSRIQNLPTDLLKLDRSFIAAITGDQPTPPLLRAIAILGIALGLPVVAEGVESQRQAETVKSLGFSFAQGFYYGRPQTHRAMLAILADCPAP